MLATKKGLDVAISQCGRFIKNAHTSTVLAGTDGTNEALAKEIAKRGYCLNRDDRMGDGELKFDLLKRLGLAFTGESNTGKAIRAEGYEDYSLSALVALTGA